MRVQIIVYTLLLISNFCFGQNLKFQLFSGEGDRITLDSVLRRMDSTQVVLFGYDSKRYETQELANFLLGKLYEKNRNLQLSSDYFLTTQQTYIDDYLQGYISDREMRRRLVKTGQIESWKIDFMNFAKDHRLDFIATKLNRSLHSRVFAQGDSIIGNPFFSQDTLTVIPDSFSVDTTKDAYKANFYVENGKLLGQDRDKVARESFANATAAHSIKKQLKPNYLLFHLTQKNRLANNRGVNWQINQIDSSIHTTTISFVTNDVYLKEQKEAPYYADIVFVIPAINDGSVSTIVEKMTYFYEFNGSEIIIPDGDDF